MADEPVVNIRLIAERTIATPGARIEGRIAGTGRNGSPLCASGPLLEHGWTIARG